MLTIAFAAITVAFFVSLAAVVATSVASVRTAF